MFKNIFKIIIVFLIGAVGGIFSEQILWPYFIERPLFLEYSLEQNPVYITETKEITIQENTASGISPKEFLYYDLGRRSSIPFFIEEWGC
jgi:hypothetical protein